MTYTDNNYDLPKLTIEDRMAFLVRRIGQIEKRLSDIETIGKPKYGTKIETVDFVFKTSLPSLDSFNFRQLRKSKNLTLRQVELMTGISNAYLSQLETGSIINPSYSVVKKLVDLYTNDIVPTINEQISAQKQCHSKSIPPCYKMNGGSCEDMDCEHWR